MDYLSKEKGDDFATAVLQFYFELNGFGLMTITFQPFRPLPIHGHLHVCRMHFDGSCRVVSPFNSDCDHGLNRENGILLVVNTVATAPPLLPATTTSDSVFFSFVFIDSSFSCVSQTRDRKKNAVFSRSLMAQIKLISFRFHSTSTVLGVTRWSISIGHVRTEQLCTAQHNTNSRHRPTEMFSLVWMRKWAPPIRKPVLILH